MISANENFLKLLSSDREGREDLKIIPSRLSNSVTNLKKKRKVGTKKKNERKKMRDVR